ncbi:MAG: histone deacetylase family protein [Promethearchaeota archaeon]
MSRDKIAFISHPKSTKHHMPFPKPNLEAFESPIRMQMAKSYLEKSGILEKTVQVRAPKATLSDVRLAHTNYLIDTVKLMSKIGSGQLGEAAYASPDLLRTALLSVGGAIKGADMVLSGDSEHAFVLMRPPGHHATTSNPMGLCYFNNVAIGVKHALKHDSIERVSVVDFDDHHGNGTSEIFYSDKNVQVISIHEYDYENFGLGHFSEVGHGEATGTNINIPLVESSPDISYEESINKVIEPALNRFKPDIIFVSAGYDAHYADPVGNMDVDSRTYWKFGDSIRKIVESQNVIGSVWALEGGYNVFALGPSIEASLHGLLGNATPLLDDQTERVTHRSIIDANRQVISKVLEAIKPLW